MNPIKNLFCSLSDAELRAAVVDMKGLDDTGILGDDGIRPLAQRVQELVRCSGSDARSIVMAEVIRHAAWRWAGIAEQLDALEAAGDH